MERAGPHSETAVESGSYAWTNPLPPVQVRRPMLYQSWRDCAFLHWDVDPDALRPLVPPSLEVEPFQGRAWVSQISFVISRMRPAGLPPIPGLAAAAESHVRTYVTGPDGRRGIWFLSLDIQPPAAALLGRVPFALPYWSSSVRIERSPDTARYRVRRGFPGKGHLDLSLRLAAPIPAAEETELDHFVTARWLLYSGVPGLRAALLAEHPRWTFRRAEVEQVDQNILDVGGLPRQGPPRLVHFSEGVDARLGWPRPLLAR
ncbi:MAG: DUF2071 domain-containing protein [Actinomycetota bacterium]|nr:DUF2071 domain-containing protein [Actinomycetota bacterium]